LVIVPWKAATGRIEVPLRVAAVSQTKCSSPYVKVLQKGPITDGRVTSGNPRAAPATKARA
jgi:hypothetical protein